MLLIGGQQVLLRGIEAKSDRGQVLAGQNVCRQAVGCAEGSGQFASQHQPGDVHVAGLVCCAGVGAVIPGQIRGVENGEAGEEEKPAALPADNRSVRHG